MEPQFKSSFIPKKPVSSVSMRQVRSKPLGILFFISAMALTASLLLVGAVFGYGEYLRRAIETKSQALEEARSNLQPALIEELRRLDARMQHTKGVLRNHLALSPVFELLEENTARSVQYDTFSYLFTPGGDIELSFTGKAASFTSLAFQSDVFNRVSMFVSATFSNLTVDELGRVGFSLKLIVDPAAISYSNLVSAMNVSRETIPLPTPGIVATSTSASSTP
jgi:hypothetical protein